MVQVGSQRSEQPKNVNFESIVRGLKRDILIGTQSKIRFIRIRFNGKKNLGVRCLLAKVMKNFHLFWNFSLTFSIFLWHQKGKLSKKEKNVLNTMLFSLSENSVYQLFQLSWTLDDSYQTWDMPHRALLNGFEMMRFFLGVYFCIFSTSLKYFNLPAFPILCSLNPDYSFIRQPLQLHILKLTFDVWPSITQTVENNTRFTPFTRP